MEDIAIKVENVSKVFKLPHEKNSSIKSAVVNFYRRDKSFEMQKALNDVSFEVKQGEFFGIVGRNGSGKSTLLKLLAGIYSPTEGNIQISGSLTPFIELGVGFNPELTGRENVFLNGALLGFNRKEMLKMYDDIVAFAELKRFMDQKLKNYSSGMQVRLAFSIAIRAKSDILLIDEVLAVGDIAFQKKCLDYFDQLKKDKRTVILVSHDMATVEKHCNRVLLIGDGKVIDGGNPKQIAAKYRLLNLAKETIPQMAGTKLLGGVTVSKVTVNGQKEVVVDAGQQLEIAISFKPKKTMTYYASISIYRSEGSHIGYYDNRSVSKKVSFQKGKTYTTVCKLPVKQFLEGVYMVDTDIYDDNDVYLAHKPAAVCFSVASTGEDKAGLVNVQGEWQLQNSKR